jgi:uncharacterized RDD family membrane protein YckC
VSATASIRAASWVHEPALDIDTVLGVPVHLRIAGPGARAYAFTVDWVIRSALAAAWFALLAFAVNGSFTLSAPQDSDTLWFLLVALPASAIYFLYHLVLECALAGRTPGKRIAGVRIVALNGSAASLGQHLLRNIFRLVDSLPVVYSVGLATTIATRRHVRIGDIAAGTLLVYDRAIDAPAPAPVRSLRAAFERVAEYRAAAQQLARARKSGDASAAYAAQPISGSDSRRDACHAQPSCVGHVMVRSKRRRRRVAREQVSGPDRPVRLS